MAAIVFVLASQIGPALLCPIVPGEHPWAPNLLRGLAAGCFAAATTLILLRVLARPIGVAMSLSER